MKTTNPILRSRRATVHHDCAIVAVHDSVFLDDPETVIRFSIGYSGTGAMQDVGMSDAECVNLIRDLERARARYLTRPGAVDSTTHVTPRPEVRTSPTVRKMSRAEEDALLLEDLVRADDQ